MKSPRDIADRMRRQWQRRQFRLDMLTSPDAWPICYHIGKPTAVQVQTDAGRIRRHIARWQSLKAGTVIWQEFGFRASSEPVNLPCEWILHGPSDWIKAASDRDIAQQYALLEQLCDSVEPGFRDVLITDLKVLQKHTAEELLALIELAKRLAPGDAQGRPLRLLAGHGVDTKFMERHSGLLTRLLDVRFDGEVSQQGLHEFLDASPDGEHWLSLVPLDDGILAFRAQLVRALELASLAPDVINASHVLLVENVQCQHQLPRLNGTLAILGSGLNLEWLRAEWLRDKQVAYWGDIDTWGMTMLARARAYIPQIRPILMSQQIFDEHAKGNAVAELKPAGENVPIGLTHDEQTLYKSLLKAEHGRLEQEYLPVEVVTEALARWLGDSK